MAESTHIEKTRDYFNFLKAISIVGIFSYHSFDSYLRFSLKTSSYAIVAEGVFKVYFEQASGILGYVVAMLKTFFSFGFLGVEVFIVASGFGLCLSRLSKQSRWAIFYKKRFFRMVPLYYLFLIVSFAVYSLRDPFFYSNEGLVILAKHFLLVQVIDGSSYLYSLYYYVALLALLYLTFPLLYRAINSDRWRMWLFVILLLGAQILDAFMGLTNWGLVLKYIPYFYFGMLFAHSLSVNTRLSRALFDYRVSLLSGTFLVLTLFLTSYVFDFIELFRAVVVFAFLFAMPVWYKLLLALGLKKIIALLSYSSYVIYLSHLVVMRIISMILPSRLFISPTPEDWLIFCIGSFVVIAASSYLVQLSCNSAIKRLPATWIGQG